MSRRLVVVSIVATTAPLLGIFGSIWDIRALQQWEAHFWSCGSNSFVPGMEFLVPVFFGPLLGITLAFLHGFLQARAEEMSVEMTKIQGWLLDELKRA